MGTGAGAGAGAGSAGSAGLGWATGTAPRGLAAGRAAAGAAAPAASSDGTANSSCVNDEYGLWEEGSSSRPDQKAATSASGTVTPRTILGVMASSSSVLSAASLVLVNREPRNGMSPNRKILLLLSVLVFWINPPMMLVSPSFSESTVSRFLVPMVTTVVAWSVPMVSLCRIELTSSPSLMETSLLS